MLCPIGVLLVCGGRDFSDRERLEKALTEIKPLIIVQGECPTGADKFAKNWAIKNHIHHADVPALWGSFGKSAGPKRNFAMAVLKPDACLAAPGGRGTADMIEKCHKRGIPVFDLDWNEIIPMPINQ